MKSIKVNALASVMVKVLNIVFPLITGPYLARILNKTDYGNFNIANTFINFFIPFATFGVYNYGVRVISHVKDHPEKVNRVFSRLFYVSMVTTILTTAVYIVYIAFFSGLGELKVLYYIMGFQILVQFIQIEWMNEAFENYKFILYKTLLIRILMLISIFVFVRKPSDILPYATLMSLTTFVNYLLSFLKIKKEVRFVKIPLREFKPLLKPLVALLLLANAGLLYTLTDRMFISGFGKPEYVTYYTISDNMVMMLAGVINGAVGVSVPRLGYYLGKGDRISYEELVNKGSRVFAFLIAPMSIGMALLGGEAVLLYGGEKYIAAGSCASIFAIRSIFWAVQVVLSTQIVFVHGMESRLTALNLICGFLNLGMDTLLYLFGISAPQAYIFTTMLAETVLNLLLILLIRRYALMPLKNIFTNLFRYLSICLGFIPVYFLVNVFVPKEMVINGRFLLNIGLVMVLCAGYYISVMVGLKDAVYLEFRRSLTGVLNRWIHRRQ